jgi:dCTP deaminase
MIRSLPIMLLSDRDLHTALDGGALIVDPLDRRMVQPSSVDVRLSNAFRVFNNHAYSHIDPRERQDELTTLVEVELDGDGQAVRPFMLHPGEFVLGATAERVEVDLGHAARLEGKSSLGRLGLLVHSTAGFVDPGFSGAVTLELSNVNTLPIALWPGMMIGQLCVFRMSSPAERGYGLAIGSRYQHQGGPTASRAWLRWGVAPERQQV